MYTLILGLLTGVLAALFSYYIVYESIVLASIVFVLVVVAFNFFTGRYFMGKITEIFNSTEKDIRNGKFEIAIEKIKTAYKYKNWQFLVKQQIDSQIGVILYANKKFQEALPYLVVSSPKNYMAMSMLAAYYYKQKEYDKVYDTMARASKANKKDCFTQVLYAYFLSETGKVDEALIVLSKAEKKITSDERLQLAADALRNRKKIKMQAFGPLWLQLHLMKTPDGVKQYQTLIGRQKITRR